MLNEKEITCIVCPIGCKILVRTSGNHFEVLSGNKCKKGIEYAGNEALDPKRMLTSTIFVKNGEWPLVSIKSSKSVPKDKIFLILKKIKKTYVNAPVKSGQKIINNVGNTNINIIATKSIKKIKKN